METLRKGGLVAFPTETVYGLGADAGNEQAVRRLFQVKGRPETHPLIVHLADRRQLPDWASEVPEGAALLAERFWPGPLTLILKKASSVLSVITGNQDSVGLRVPRHPLALELLRDFGTGVAAPSANRFGKVSPTSAKHVRADLGTDVDLILDGGPCAIGVESTIVDFSSAAPRILRPGGLTQEELQEALHQKLPVVPKSVVRASGQLDSHYAPQATVVISSLAEAPGRAAEFHRQGKRVQLLSPEDVQAENLYASLRRADGKGVDVIVVPLPDEGGLGLAVADRLRKAAAPR